MRKIRIQELDISVISKELTPYINQFSDARVLVIGDIILDEYIWGDVSRISPEAPVPVVDVLAQDAVAVLVYRAAGQADVGVVHDQQRIEMLPDA